MHGALESAVNKCRHEPLGPVPESLLLIHRTNHLHGAPNVCAGLGHYIVSNCLAGLMDAGLVSYEADDLREQRCMTSRHPCDTADNRTSPSPRDRPRRSLREPLPCADQLAQLAPPLDFRFAFDHDPRVG